MKGANRANARRSRGPTSPAGVRRILEAATIHGLYSKAPCKAMRALGEDPLEFDGPLEGLMGLWGTTERIRGQAGGAPTGAGTGGAGSIGCQETAILPTKPESERKEKGCLDVSPIPESECLPRRLHGPLSGRLDPPSRGGDQRKSDDGASKDAAKPGNEPTKPFEISDGYQSERGLSLPSVAAAPAKLKAERVNEPQGQAKNFEAESHDVYENKDDTGGASGESHDVVENKEPISQGA